MNTLPIILYSLGAINIEEKRLCDVHQHTSPTLIEATVKSSDKFSSDKHNYSIVSTNQAQSDEDNQTGLPNLGLDQQSCIQLFTMPMCTTVQVGVRFSSANPESRGSLNSRGEYSFEVT